MSISSPTPSASADRPHNGSQPGRPHREPMSRYQRDFIMQRFGAYLSAGRRLRYVTMGIEKHVAAALEQMAGPDDAAGLELAYMRVPLPQRPNFRSAWEHFCTFGRSQNPPMPTCGVPKPHARETAPVVEMMKLADAFLVEAAPERRRRVAMQATKVRTALRRMADMNDVGGLYRYYNSLAPSSQRVFRHSWRAFADFWRDRGIQVAQLHRPKRGRPPSRSRDTGRRSR